MNITITFRHMDASEAVKSYARDKVGKLQKFLRQPMTAKVTLSLDKLRRVAEVQVSSGGSHLEAKESNEDMHAAIDRVIDKLERQIRGTKGVAEAKKVRGGKTLRKAADAVGPAPRVSKAPKKAKAKAPAKKRPAGAIKR